jgi:hypothetical protein
MGTSFQSASNVGERHQQRAFVFAIQARNKTANAAAWENASQLNRMTSASE